MRLSIRLSEFGSPRTLCVVLLTSISFLVACESDEEQMAALMASGTAYAEQGHHAEAIIEFRKALQIDPSSAEAHFQLGISYVDRRKTREALWEFAETVRLDPDNSDARLKLGAIALMLQGYEEALSQAEAAIRLVPEESTAYLLYARALEELERGAEAEAPYLKAVALDPEEASLLEVLGNYYVRQDRRSDAEPTFVRLTEVSPSFRSYSSLGRFHAADPSRAANAESAFKQALVEVENDQESAAAYDQLARFYLATERPDDASQILEEGIAALEDDAASKVDLIHALADVLTTQDRGDEAMALLESAVALQPDSPRSQLRLSKARDAAGDLVGALEAADQAIATAPDSLDARLTRADLLIRIGHDSEDETQISAGIAILDAVLVDEPTNPRALFERGKAAAVQNDAEGAIKFLRASLDARSESAPAHLMLGRALAATGETGAARAEVARALELDPSLATARHLLIRLHSALGEYEYAVDQGRIYLRGQNDRKTRMLVAQSLGRLGRTHDALVAIDRIPEKHRGPDVLFAKARLLVADRQLEEARGLLVRTLEANPDNPGVLRLLMRVDGDLGRLADAGKLITAASQANPEDPELSHLQGVYALRSGDAETAEAMFSRTLELDPANVPAFRQLAQIYQKAGRVDEAIATYDQALEKSPDSAQLHYLLAALRQAKGESKLAIKGYEKALEFDPELAGAMNNLAYLLADSGEDLDRALDLAQQAKAQRPDDPSTSDTLGWVLYHRGISGAAVGYLREAVAELEPGSEAIGIARHHLALAYEANDQKQLAIDALELSLAELAERQQRARTQGGTPDDPEWSGTARELLARLKGAG